MRFYCAPYYFVAASHIKKSIFFLMPSRAGEAQEGGEESSLVFLGEMASFSALCVAGCAFPGLGEDDDDNEASLRDYVRSGRCDLVVRDLELGADPNTEDELGRTLLWTACFHGRTTVVEALLKDRRGRAVARSGRRGAALCRRAERRMRHFASFARCRRATHGSEARRIHGFTRRGGRWPTRRREASTQRARRRSTAAR